MSLLLANIFNIALIFLENIMLLILVNGLFRREKASALGIISFLLMSTLSCLVIFFFDSNLVLKYCILFVLSSSWVFFSYKAPIIKCIFPVAFWLAYLTIMDNAVISFISALMSAEAQQLLSTPESYYFIFFSTKITEGRL